MMSYQAGQHALSLEELTLLKYPFYPKHSTGSLFYQITHDDSHRTRTILKFIWNHKRSRGME